jgi:NADH-quinone oxidoreductase subunit M
MLLLLIIVIPLLAALLAVFSKSGARQIIQMASYVNLAITIVLYTSAASLSEKYTGINLPWIASMGIHFNLYADGISLVMLLLTNLLIPFILWSAASHQYRNENVFYALVAFMQAGLVGVFAAQDAFLFYVFYEIALIPIFFICAFWGGKDRIRITVKFFIYTLAGSLFMLIAIIYLYLKTPGTHTFDIQAFYNLPLSTTEQTLILWAFVIAFAVKIPLVPFHTWQADTYTMAPAAGTMLLSGIMLKMGLYGLIRFVLPVAPLAVHDWQNWLMALSVSGVVYGAIIAIKQNDIKTLLAYSSLSHVGLIAAGIFAGNTQGIQGAVVQMFNHGISVVALFSLADIIEQRSGTRIISELSGLVNRSRQLAVVFMIVMLGAIGLPLTNGFIGEFLLLFSVFKFNAIAGGIACTTIILGAVYMLRMYRNVFFGEAGIFQAFSPFNQREMISLYTLAALVIILGVYPSIITSVSADAAGNLIKLLNPLYSVR